MNPFQQNWRRLTAAARLAPEIHDAAEPYGFATRVAALALAGRRLTPAALFERLGWRALGLAFVLAAVSFAASYPAIATTADEVSGIGDAVVEVLNLS